MFFDVAAMVKDVDAGSDAAAEWLEQSWRLPDAFVAALAAYAAGPGAPALKSRDGFDLYYDFVSRHVPGRRVAFAGWEINAGWRTLTFAELDARAAALGAAWASQGVEPGKAVALVLPLGVDHVVALAAALRLGAVVTPLGPHGGRLVARHLELAKPDFLVSDEIYRPLWRATKAVRLDGSGRGQLNGSHTYAADDAVAALCTPLAAAGERPVALPAARAFAGALADGVLGFGLRPGDLMAAPGFDLEATQPALVLAAWSRGAGYVHVEARDLAATPTLLERFRLRALGVTAATRDLWLQARVRPRDLGLWWRNAEEPLDWSAWRRFVHDLGLTQVPCANLLVDAAAGGIVLASARRRGEIHVEAHSAPGRSWALLDSNASGQASARDAGLWSPDPADKTRTPYVLVARGVRELIYAGTLTPRRAGRVFPDEAVIDAVAELPWAAGASVVPVPGRQVVRFVLVVFTGADEAAAGREAARHTAELRGRLVAAVGEDNLPDRVDLFALFPRLRDGAVDHAWCRDQYLNGSLHRKARHPLFRQLTALRQLTRPPKAP